MRLQYDIFIIKYYSKYYKKNINHFDKQQLVCSLNVYLKINGHYSGRQATALASRFFLLYIPSLFGFYYLNYFCCILMIE